MAVLEWNQIGDRWFEAGLDRGVLYLQDGTAIPWNGLISVKEKVGAQITPVYWDGKKYNDHIIPGDFEATLTAFTYPDEFEGISGLVEVGNGILVHNQVSRRFNLSYRTKIGNDVNGLDAGYKIHILYNLLANPSDVTNKTIDDTLEPIVFSWDLSAVAISIMGYEPTAHVVVDTTKASSEMVSVVENALYGTISTAPYLLSLNTIISLGLGEY